MEQESVLTNSQVIFQMSTIPVNLPEELKSFVDDRAQKSGFEDAAAYITALVAAAQKSQNNLEQALLDGFASSPAQPWTDEEWQAIRDRVRAHGTQR